MNRHDLAWQLPLRLTAGTFVLDSGLHKRDPDEETAKHLHGFASGASWLVAIGAALILGDRR
jgi:galactose mutarotase-like enzyme